jgi:hypothetical protein
MNLIETIKNFKLDKQAELIEDVNAKTTEEGLEEASEVGGGATGVSKVADPTNVRAKAPGNSKSQGETAPVKIQDPNSTGVEETDMANNTKSTGNFAAKNKTSVAAKNTGMKEHMSAIFSGEDLSEEFKEKASIIFEAAVSERLIQITEELQAEYENALSVKLEEIEKENNDTLFGLTEKVDEYLSYAIGHWMEENQLAVEHSLKSEITEEFIRGLKNLFSENYIDIPEEKFNVVEELSTRVQELEDALNSAINENIELTVAINEMASDEAFDEIAEGLTATQTEKFKNLAEGLEFDDAETYKKKLSIIKENYFAMNTNVPSVKKQNLLEEAVDVEEEEQKLHGSMAHYVKAISRTIVK